MKKFKWVFIALGLIALVVLTMPVDGFLYSICDHEYVTDACNVQRCTKCADAKTSQASHTWKKVDCSETYCTVCGETKVTGHNFEKINCTNKRICRDCGYIEYSQYKHHPGSYTVEYTDCSYETFCEECNEYRYGGVSHEWNTYKDHSNAHCRYCGVAAPANIEHNLKYSFFKFFSFCSDCGYVGFQIPNFLLTAAFIGFIISVAAFVFIFLNRKRITVQGGKYIRMATPDAHLREEEIF